MAAPIRQPSASAEGLSGRLRHGYEDAATVGAWRLSLAPDLPRRYVLSGVARTVSAYWLGEEPLTLDLAFGPDRWIWERVACLVEDGRISGEVEGTPTIVRGAR